MADNQAANDVEDAKVTAAFAAGFDSDTPPPVEVTAPAPEPAKEEPKPAEAAAPAKPEKVKPAEPPKPKYVQITEEDYAKLQAAVTETAELKKQMRDAFGNIGSIKDIVKKLQEATPKGMVIDLPADVTSKLEKDFSPELASAVRDALQNAFKNGVRGTADAPKGAEFDHAAVRKVVMDARSETELESLNSEFPDWRKIVGAPDADDGPVDPNNPFRKWLASKPDDYQKTISNTRSSLVIMRAIDKFHREKSEPARTPDPKPEPTLNGDARRQRIQHSIQPRGDGGPAPPRKTVQDAFAEGFKS